MTAQAFDQARRAVAFELGDGFDPDGVRRVLSELHWLSALALIAGDETTASIALLKIDAFSHLLHPEPN
jgi:hypothetical protein